MEKIGIRYVQNLTQNKKAPARPGILARAEPLGSILIDKFMITWLRVSVNQKGGKMKRKMLIAVFATLCSDKKTALLVAGRRAAHKTIYALRGG